jgi:hypothetical protein
MFNFVSAVGLVLVEEDILHFFDSFQPEIIIAIIIFILDFAAYSLQSLIVLLSSSL